MKERPKTWLYDSGGIVSWNYRPMARSDGRLIPLNLEAPDVRRDWLCGLIRRVPALLGDFAIPAEVDVTNHDSGESACVVDLRTKDGPSLLMDFLEKERKVRRVEMALDLTCLGEDLEPFLIRWGAEFWVRILLTDSGTLNATADAPVYLRIRLMADIYSPVTQADMDDNTFLARLNGPRLTHFLERIERDVPAQFLEMAGAHYNGMVGPRGFTAPDAAPEGA
jgi:hypothetical protein